jgi:2-oxoglutarate dehydrogenase complex dehydrogenase (E1) component-like enzyme
MLVRRHVTTIKSVSTVSLSCWIFLENYSIIRGEDPAPEQPEVFRNGKKKKLTPGVPHAKGTHAVKGIKKGTRATQKETNATKKETKATTTKGIKKGTRATQKETNATKKETKATTTKGIKKGTKATTDELAKETIQAKGSSLLPFPPPPPSCASTKRKKIIDDEDNKDEPVKGVSS